MKFLVTGANGDIGEAIGRILREQSSANIVDGADSSGTMPAACLFNQVHVLPPAKSPNFLPAFQDLAERYDCVIPVPEAELIVLASQSFATRGYSRLLMNEPWVISIFCDKLKTFEWLTDFGDISAKTMLLTEASGRELPVVVKPRFGWGSKGVEIVQSVERLALLQREASGGWIAQTFLDADDQEYTCAIIRDGDVINTLVMLRSLQGGLTKQAEIVSHDAIEELLTTIARGLPERAFVNVQLRVAHGKPQVFEINPRFSSTVMMRHLVGFHDLLWAIASFGGTPMSPAHIPPGPTIYRLSREIVVRK